MGEKDIAEKILLAYNDVFSDIVNVLLFGGQEVIQGNDLEDQTTISAYKADGKLHEIDRDVAKRWKTGNLRLACVGFENQTSSDSAIKSDFRVVQNSFSQRENSLTIPQVINSFNMRKKFCNCSVS